MITPKKRFEVLKINWFRCKYCWRNGENVSLEVDHIIPKKKWWWDDIDNLVCCCRECNMWKWDSDVAIPAKISYKTKIHDTAYKLKTYFYTYRNERKMWSIDKETTILLSFLCDSWIKWKDNDRYMWYMDIPPLYWENSPYWNDWRNVDCAKMCWLFQEWWNFCDDVLDIILDEQKIYIEDIIDTVYDNSNWERNSDTDYAWKLNYKLTEHLSDEYGNIIRKYTLFPKLLNNG